MKAKSRISGDLSCDSASTIAIVRLVKNQISLAGGALVLLLTGGAVAAPPKRAAPAPAAPVVDTKPKAPATTFEPGETTAGALKRVETLYKSLEYDKVMPIADEILKRPDLTLDQKLDAYRYLGSAKAIVEDPIDAEKPFRMLLRARPDYDLPQDTPPKILTVFRKVQTEEKALAGQLAEVERARTVSGLKLIGEPPTAAKGGRPLPFSFRLKDPTGAVDTVRVAYRRSGQTTYSQLALQRAEDGDWRGQIPGEFTSDEKGFVLEYYVDTADAKGVLLTMGTGPDPKRIDVSAGTLAQAQPPPLPKWAWFAGAGVTALIGATAGGAGIAFNNTQSDYTRRVSGGGEVDGADLKKREGWGNSLATATNVSLIAAGVALVATAVMTPFVNWSGEEGAPTVPAAEEAK